MSEEQKDVRADPEYSRGYSHCISGFPLPTAAGGAYAAGWEAAKNAQSILRRAGFTDDGGGSYSLTINNMRRTGE